MRIFDSHNMILFNRMEQKGLNWLIKTVFFCVFANLINNLSQEPVWLTNSDIQAGIILQYQRCCHNML